MKYVSDKAAVALVPPRARVFVHGGAMTPTPLVEALSARAPELDAIEFVHIHTEGPAPYATTGSTSPFSTRSFFVAGNIRAAVNGGNADYVPISLTDIPHLIQSDAFPIDVALLQVSPPDAHGFCSLGASVDIALAASQRTKILIGLVNRRAPRSHGEGLIHVDRFSALVEHDAPLHGHSAAIPTPEEAAIGRHVAGLFEDGATLQVGIGAIPNAVVAELFSHRELGLHTEMFSDGILDLVSRGVLTNSRKKVLPGRIVSAFALGSQRLYDFLHDNPMVEM